MAIGSLNSSTTSAMNATRNANKAAKQKQKAMEALSSGLRINKASDDPSGLVISELLRSQISGYSQALRNTQEANNVMSIAEGGLSSVSSMLTNMRGLAIQALNSGITSDAQVQANQMEMNSYLSTISRVVTTTNYSGSKLLDGSTDFTYDTVDAANLIDTGGTSISSVSGSLATELAISYSGDVSAQAEKAYIETDFGGETLSEAQEFTLTGADGSYTFSFAAGTSIEDMADQINNLSDSTGVTAYAIQDQGSGATALRMVSSEYGSDASVKVDQISGNAFTSQGGTVVDYGQDASLTVNGQQVTTDGLTANVNGSVSATVQFQEGSTTATTIAQTGYDQDTLTDATTAQSASITNITGGMQLQLGEGSSSANRENISLGNYNTANLGQVEYEGQTYSINDLYGGGAASLANNPELALKIIDQAIADVASGRADIGAYQANALDSNANNLMVAIENTTAAESGIRDADMAAMMTTFVQNQLLENVGLKMIQSSNMNATNVLSLLTDGLNK